MKNIITAILLLLPLIAAQTQTDCELLQQCSDAYLASISQNVDLPSICASAAEFYDCALLYADSCVSTDFKAYIEQSQSTIEQFCASPPEACNEEAPNSRGKREVCTIFGDPHIRTFSGVDFTNNALAMLIYEDEFLKISSVNFRPVPTSPANYIKRAYFRYKLTCAGYNGELASGTYGSGAHKVVIQDIGNGRLHLRFHGPNVDVVYDTKKYFMHVSSPFYSTANGDCAKFPANSTELLTEEQREALFNSLPEADQLLATESCTDDLDPTFQNGCLFDVAISQNVTFAETAREAQEARATVVAMGDGLPATPASSDASVKDLTCLLLLGSALLLL